MNYIYKITNDVNGKVYIGQTALDIYKRFEKHKLSAYDKTKWKKPLYVAMREFGVDKFHVHLMHIYDNLEEANIQEQYLILKYKAHIYGYNAALGGDDYQFKPTYNVCRVNPLTLEIVRVYSSAREVAKYLNINTAFIVLACMDHVTIFNEYYWCFTKDYPAFKKKIEDSRNGLLHNLTINKLDLSEYGVYAGDIPKFRRDV